MTTRSTPMLKQIHCLPDMVKECLPLFKQAIEEALPNTLCSSITHFYLTGTGDSYHATLGAELAFRTLSGVYTQSMTALHFARYTVPFLPEPDKTAVIAISVSGEVSRTVESVRLAKKMGATTFAITGNLDGRLALSADRVLRAQIPPIADGGQGMPIPGVRSYIASLLMLYLTAIHVGEARGYLSPEAAASARNELQETAEGIEATIQATEATIKHLVEAWKDASEFVFLGGGPNYGTALNSAAKILEASGDAAWGQDMEEWAHLQYFAREPGTPTFIIDAGGRSNSRAREIAVAAKTIGRRVAAIVPQGESAISAQAEAVLAVQAQVREAFSPLLYDLAGMLFADYRAQLVGERYFRNFGGGRSVEGGGGISRIRTSVIQEEIEP